MLLYNYVNVVLENEGIYCWFRKLKYLKMIELVFVIELWVNNKNFSILKIKLLDNNNCLVMLKF